MNFSCHAAQASKGNYQKTCYKTPTCRPRLYWFPKNDSRNVPPIDDWPDVHLMFTTGCRSALGAHVVKGDRGAFPHLVHLEIVVNRNSFFTKTLRPFLKTEILVETNILSETLISAKTASFNRNTLFRPL